MAKKYNDLIAHRAPESQARVEALHQKLRAETSWHELRQAQALSQDTHLGTARQPGGDLSVHQP